MDTISTGNPIQDAIAQIKAWETEGKTQEAIDGCKEILEVDPNNMEAKNLLAELEKPATPTPMPEVKPVIASEIPTTSNPAETPLYNIKTEPAIATPTKPEPKKSHGIVLNLVMFAIVIALIGGGAYIYLNYFKTTETTPPKEEETLKIDLTATTQQPEEDTTVTTEPEETAQTRNEQRLEDLTYLETQLDTYYEINHMYPSPDELETALGELRYDPTDEEEFKYAYAVYDNYLGEKQEYILSALFEEEDGTTTTWTTGASTADHADYRGNSLENVTYITSSTDTTKVKRK